MSSDKTQRVGRPIMAFNSAWPAVLVLLVLSVLCSSASAQQPSIRPFDSEEDLWEALNDGEITFDEFTELLDLSRFGADSLVLPSSDWEALPGSETGYLVAPDSNQTLENPLGRSKSRIDVPYLTSLRNGVDGDLTDPAAADGYAVINLRGADWRANLDWEHDHEDGARWRRRSLIWQLHDLTIQVGSIEPRWGRGLVVGRRSRVISASDVSGNFWQPTRARFNGAWLSSSSKRPLSAQAFASEIRGDSMIERVVATRVEVKEGPHRVGVTGLMGGHVYDPSRPTPSGQSTEYDRMIGADYRLSFTKGAILAEFAIDQEGASAKTAELAWNLPHGQFHTRLWSYGADFISPWGGGPGNGDIRQVQLEQFDRTFSSRTAGERGFDFTTRLAAAPSVNLRWDWMSHREEPGATVEHSGVFRAEIKQSTFRTTPFVRAAIDEDETESYSVGNYLWMGPDERELNVRLEFGTHYDDEVQFVRAGLGATLQLNRTVRLTPAIRWNDPNLDSPSDGYWYIYFTEAVVPIQGARVEMALAWKKYEDADKDDLVELRVRGYLK